MKPDTSKIIEQSSVSNEGDQEPAKAPKRRNRHSLWWRVPLWMLVGLLVFILLIPVLIYLPPVQTVLKDVACAVVKESTGMDVSIGRFRLKFPLDVSLTDVLVLEATGDTMVKAREAIADVKLRPLLSLDVQLNRLRLLDGYYRMLSSDSSMLMKIRAGELDVDGKSSAQIRSGFINLNEVQLKDGDVSLFMDVWKKQPTPTDTSATPFIIKANHLRLERFRFAMSMLPTIDTLDFSTGTLELRQGEVNLADNFVSIGSVTAADGDVTFLTPTAEYVRTHPAPVDTISSPSPPMVISGDSISLDRFKALYGIAGAKPTAGFDANYISLNEIAIGLRGFYNKASEIRLPITRLMARERCGLAITSGRGTVSVDSVGLGIRDFNLTTLRSKLFANAEVPFALMELQPDAVMSVLADASVSPADIVDFMPSLRSYTKLLPSAAPVNLQLKADGSISDLTVGSLKLAIPRVLDLAARGHVRNPMDIKKLVGKLDFDANLSGPAVVDRLIGGTGINIPRLSLKGSATADRQTYAARFNLQSEAGDAVGDGKVSLTAESYNVDVDIHGLQVDRFLPDLGVGRVSAHIDAVGAGFNPVKSGAHTLANVRVGEAVYRGHDLHGVELHADLSGGTFDVSLFSPNPKLDLSVDATGTVAPDEYTFDVRARINHADLQALGLVETICSGNGNIYLKGTASPDRWLYDVDLRVDNFDWNLPDGYIHLPQGLTANILSTPSSVNVGLECESTSLEFSSASDLKKVVDSFTAIAPVISKQIEDRHLDVEMLQASLPDFRLDASASGRGLIRQLLTASGMSVDTVYATVTNDSLIHANFGVLKLNTGSLKIDTVTLSLSQRGSLLDYRAHLGNAPGTLDEFAKVNINGYVGGNRASVSLTQQNLQGQTGYRLGFTAAVLDSMVSVHFSPLKATIAYLPWTFNADNHVDYTFANSHIDANLLAQSAESSILLLTETNAEGEDDLIVRLQNIHIQDFLQLSVFAPPIKASVSTDLKIGLRKKAILANGSVNVDDFFYNRTRVGNFELDLKAGMGQTGSAGGVASLKVNGRPALSFQGALMKDSAGGITPKGIKLKLTQFPLSVANPFLGADVASLSGVLNGQMALTGSLSKPILTGSIGCDSVAVYVPMIGSSLRFPNDSIVVTDNVLSFRQFKILAANDNPIMIDGSVDASDFSNINLNIGLSGRNVQLIGNDRKAKSPVFGKLFVDLDASARGPMKHFDINANLSILSATDINYQLQTDAQTIVEQKQNGEVVTFVQFADTTQVNKADSVASMMSMRILASLSISPGAHAVVFLSPNNSTNRVELNPSGTLRYFQNYMGDMRLNGQLNLGEGFARYSLPGVGEKKFAFDPNSYVLWNGDIMNPLLHISAFDDMKVNVVQSGGNSRLVDFKVSLAVSNTLSSPGVTFDLSADDDVTIQNELQSMSADQRATQAMNLLLTGQYSGQGVKTASNSNFATSLLYNFLTSQVNTWAANHIRGVDLSFGVDQYDKTVDGQSSTTTSYSYQVSKSLFNNKFKIVVGGNYSTDASADENFAQNLLSDISFEYMIKQTNTLSMYLKLFRHNGFESIVEGEVTETGVGFVMRRRLSNLRQLFRFHRKKKANVADSVPTVLSDSITNSPDTSAQ